jgi:two-component system NtrC family sensor kinase
MGVVRNLLALKAREGEVMRQAAQLQKLLDELEATQNQLMQQARMATIGNLATGLAHEIGNPLNLTVGGAEALNLLIEELMEEGQLHSGAWISRAQHCSELIIRGSERIDGIVEKLKNLAETERDEGTCVLSEVIATALSIVEREARESGISIQVDVETGPQVMVRGDELSQVFLNLLRNAIDAAGEGGQVDILAQMTDDTISVDVTDSGAGVPKEHQGQIFDAFFTTKTEGHGAGIGLAVSQQIVHHVGGTLTLEPSDLGACFRVVVPRSS